MLRRYELTDEEWNRIAPLPVSYTHLDHNTSGNMEKLQIKFDKLTSHDITFVGIIQTARASGLEKFPVPYVPVSYTHLVISKCWITNPNG